jgi:hypothetical protein
LVWDSWTVENCEELTSTCDKVYLYTMATSVETSLQKLSGDRLNTCATF